MAGKTPKLLPCPFCGSEASWMTGVDDAVPQCGADGCWATLGAYGTEEEAVAAWNRRALELEAAALAEALLNLADQFADLHTRLLPDMKVTKNHSYAEARALLAARTEKEIAK